MKLSQKLNHPQYVDLEISTTMTLEQWICVLSDLSLLIDVETNVITTKFLENLSDEIADARDTYMSDEIDVGG